MDLDEQYLLDRLGWLVRLRWWAVGGVAAVALAADRLGVVPSSAPHLAVDGALAAANLIFLARHRRMVDPARSALEREVQAQLLTDVLALTLLLHFADGIENPLVLFFTLLVAIAAKLLPERPAYLVATSAIALHGGTVLAEHLGWVAHHALVVAPGAVGPDLVVGSRLFMAAYLTAFTATLLGLVAFVQSLACRYRAAQVEQAKLERVAASRERLARLGELAAGVAHGIRNPLHGLMGCVAQLRLGEASEEERAETLAMLDEGLARIGELTHRLLTFTRQTGSAPRVVDLRGVVDEVVRFAQARSRADPERVRFDPGPGVFAMVDPDRVCEALANVIDNALAASRSGDLVHVRLRCGRGEADLVCIEVEDSGEGIRPEVLPRVFDPFFTTKAVGKGSGLGLAITRRIVEEEGGRVEIDSEPARGTRLRLYLPPAGLAQDSHVGRP